MSELADKGSESISSLIKKGNKSSLIASIGNAFLAVAKFFAATFSGSGALFASAMHSTADAVNQGFVYIGSILSEKKTNPKIPDRLWQSDQYFLYGCRDCCHYYGL